MLLIFDWDGTLLDSADKIVAAMQAAVAETGLDFRDAASIREIIGLGLPEALQSLYGTLPRSDHEALRAAYARHFVARDRVPCACFPGVPETLERLSSAGHRLAVATGKSRRGLDRTLGALEIGGLFHASRCADETASKPDPRMLRELLDETGYAEQQALMVGDTEFDMEMAARAGIRRIAVAWGAHPLERLRRWEPSLCLERFSQLADWVDAQSEANQNC